MSNEKWVRDNRQWDEYPLGTKAKAFMGGHWIKTEHGWKWHLSHCSFPTPGGDATGEVCLPFTDLYSALKHDNVANNPLQQLPADVQEQIENKALEISNYDHHNERHLCPYDKGRYSGYVSGASAWAIWKQRYDELKAQPQAVWVKAELGNYDTYPLANKNVFIRYDKNGYQKEVGDLQMIIELLENGWLNVEWLDESGTAEPWP